MIYLWILNEIIFHLFCHIYLNLMWVSKEWRVRKRLRMRWLLLSWLTVSPHYNTFGTIWSWCVCPLPDIQPSFLHLTTSILEKFFLHLWISSLSFCLRCLLMMQLHNKILSQLSVNMHSDTKMLLMFFWLSSCIWSFWLGSEPHPEWAGWSRPPWCTPQGLQSTRMPWERCCLEMCTVHALALGSVLSSN